MITWNQIVPIGKDEKAFVRLGARIAALCNAYNIAEVQLAEFVKVSQQIINAYEVGRRRIPAAKKCDPAPKLQRQMESIQDLPRGRQRFVMQVIDTVLAQQDR